MGFRYRKIVRLGKGLRLNISKRGVSASVGSPGLTANVGKRPRVTFGAPGTGLSYQVPIKAGRSQKAGRSRTTEIQSIDDPGCALGCFIVAISGAAIAAPWLLLFLIPAALVWAAAYVRAPSQPPDEHVAFGSDAVIPALWALRVASSESRFTEQDWATLMDIEYVIAGSGETRDHAREHRLLGECFDNLADTGRAMAHYEAALAIAPDIGCKRRLSVLRRKPQ